MDAERLRSALRDQAWRLNNLYQIIPKGGRRPVPFRLNWAQEQFYQNLWYNNLILKARQFGFSTLVDLIFLDTCVFVPNMHAAVIAHEREAAEELYARNIGFPYDHLPESLRAARGADRRNVHSLKFSNGSSIRVATSVRSGTMQLLHVSEFGKICAKYPDKAREIVTGSLETVGQGQLIVIESTAEGAEGYFHDYCQEALRRRHAGKRLTRLDWRLHFMPWWRHPDYVLDETVPIDDAHTRYFEELEAAIGRRLSSAQKAWWVKKFERLDEDMYREYPGTEDEAFRLSIQGAWYTRVLARALQDGRVTTVPMEARAPINTFWDLGIDDFTAIWLHQRVGLKNQFVKYLEGSGEDLQTYANALFRLRDQGYVLGTHYFPHDAKNRHPSHGRSVIDTADELGLRPNVIVTTPELAAGIQAVREVFPTCWFDERGCAQGLKRLAHYRKEWNDRLGAFQSTPRKDDNAQGAYSTQICHPFQRKVATQSGVKLTTGRSAATRMVHC